MDVFSYCVGAAEINNNSYLIKNTEGHLLWAQWNYASLTANEGQATGAGCEAQTMGLTWFPTADNYLTQPTAAYEAAGLSGGLSLTLLLMTQGSENVCVLQGWLWSVGPHSIFICWEVLVWGSRVEEETEGSSRAWSLSL